MTRHDSAWVTEPATAVYLILPEHADECLDVHQPFVSQQEFDEYVKANPKIAAQNPQAFTIAHYELMVEAGKPR